MQANDSSFWKYKVYALIFAGGSPFLWVGRSNDDGLVVDGNFRRF